MAEAWPERERAGALLPRLGARRVALDREPRARAVHPLLLGAVEENLLPHAKKVAFKVQETGETGTGSLEKGDASGEVFWISYCTRIRTSTSTSRRSRWSYRRTTRTTRTPAAAAAATTTTTAAIA